MSDAANESYRKFLDNYVADNALSRDAAGRAP